MGPRGLIGWRWRASRIGPRSLALRSRQTGLDLDAPGAKAKQEVVFTHEGSRYMVGFTRSDEPVYGVWDAQVDIVILCRSVVVA